MIHAFTHIASVVSTLRRPTENDQQLVNRILLSPEELTQVYLLLSSKYTIDVIRNVLVNDQFIGQLNKINKI